MNEKLTACKECKHCHRAGVLFFRWMQSWGHDFALCKARPRTGSPFDFWTGQKCPRGRITDSTHHFCSVINNDGHCPHFEVKP